MRDAALPAGRALRYRCLCALRPRPIRKAPRTVPKNPPPEPTFEQALAELEALVDQLEQGELTLEASLASFERGVALAGICQRALAQAEQRVEILAGKDADARLEPFDSAE